jgi:hypothetical protein
MAFTRGLFRLDEVRGPQWRQARLNGVSMAGVTVTGVQPFAGLCERRHGAAAGIHAPGAWAS